MVGFNCLGSATSLDATGRSVTVLRRSPGVVVEVLVASPIGGPHTHKRPNAQTHTHTHTQPQGCDTHNNTHTQTQTLTHTTNTQTTHTHTKNAQ